MKKIFLTQGMFATVDDADYEELSRFKWQAVTYRGLWYAVRYRRLPGKESSMKMHRQILGLTDPSEHVDHIDHNGLNNQRSNLRKSNHAQNNKNHRAHKGSTSKYVGVCWHKKDKKWQAAFRDNGKQRHIGQFDSEIAAAIARDMAVKRVNGRLAHLNVLSHD